MSKTRIQSRKPGAVQAAASVNSAVAYLARSTQATPSHRPAKSSATASVTPADRRALAGRRIRGWLGGYLVLALVAGLAGNRAALSDPQTYSNLADRTGAKFLHTVNSALTAADLQAAGRPIPPAGLGDVLRVAEGLKGRPYLYGGADEDGFDCSGFTYYVYGRAGYRIPRTVREQYRGLISIRAPRPGDLVFFETSADIARLEGGELTANDNGVQPARATHVGIYLGKNRFIHAPRTGGEVRIESMATGYWQQRFLGARAVIVPELAESDFGDE